jgi:hypothetical protein
VLICSSVDVNEFSPGGPGEFPKGVYHAYDYPFYYFDIRANAANRVQRYQSEH